MAERVEQTECKTFYGRSGVSSYLGSMDNVNWLGMVREPLLPGTQATPEVACTVASCKYWREGDLCDADEIKVSGQGADECQDTNCATYVSREGERGEDG